MKEVTEIYILHDSIHMEAQNREITDMKSRVVVT